MKTMASRLPEAELRANQAFRQKKTEAELFWNNISKSYQEKLAVYDNLRLRLRYLLDKTQHKLLREPAGF